MTTAELQLARSTAITLSTGSTMKELWDRNISLTTRLVDTVTTPMLLKIVRSGKLQPKRLITHRFAMEDMMKAYDTFANAAKEGALKVVLTSGGLH